MSYIGPFPIILGDGGANAALTASNGGIVYSGASALAILSGTATARQMLQSGASTTPAWSTSTYPATNAINTILYASAANVMSSLATANTGVLATSGTGVPSITSYPQVTGLGIGASPGSSAGLTFDGSNFLNAYSTGTFTPTLTGASTAGTTTYGVQVGYYTRIGNLVFTQFVISPSASTGTGTVVLGGLPFTIKNQSNGYPIGSIALNVNTTFTASTTSLSLIGIINTSTAQIFCSGTGVVGGYIQMASFSGTFFCTLVYQI